MSVVEWQWTLESELVDLSWLKCPRNGPRIQFRVCANKAIARADWQAQAKRRVLGPSELSTIPLSVSYFQTLITKAS